MGKKRPSTDPPPAPGGPFHDAFASLRDRLPQGFSPEAPTPTAPPAASARPPPARALVRVERTRRGKEVTVVKGLSLAPGALEEWLRDAKRDLGCGGTIDLDALSLQGDHRERIARWLSERGVRKITVAR